MMFLELSKNEMRVMELALQFCVRNHEDKGTRKEAHEVLMKLGQELLWNDIEKGVRKNGKSS